MQPLVQRWVLDLAAPDNNSDDDEDREKRNVQRILGRNDDNSDIEGTLAETIADSAPNQRGGGGSDNREAEEEAAHQSDEEEEEDEEEERQQQHRQPGESTGLQAAAGERRPEVEL
jgi:hypothetical protein